MQGVSDLSELVEPLKREIAVPGTFATTFPDTSDDDLAATLADAFGAGQLNGYFGGQTLTVDPDLGTYVVSPDLSAAGAALVVIYAGMRIIRSQLRGINTMARYKAGPVEYETQQSATLLREELAYLRQRETDLLTVAQRATSIYVMDAYLHRAVVYSTDLLNSAGGWTALGGFHDYER